MSPKPAKQSQRRCRSTFCVTVDGLKGRLFTPPVEALGIANVWCPECIKISSQLQFFTQQTASMIHAKFEQYDSTNLPKEVKLFLYQFTQELLQELGDSL